MIAADTTVAVAAVLPGHGSHVAASSALRRQPVALIAHVALETYSVLTRLPPPRRIPPADVHGFLARMFVHPPLALSSDGYDRLLDRAPAEGIVGGAVYDALVGETARDAGATLLTLDRRAVRVYELLDVDYLLLE